MMIRHYAEKKPYLKIYFKKTEQKILLDYRLMYAIRHAVKETLRYENLTKSVEISLTCCSNEDIRRLNRLHRNKDKETDVLSFPLYEGRQEIDSEMLEPVMLGDVVISYEFTEKQAREFGHSTEREIVFLTIHSILHLLGYDHEKSADEDEVMCDKQKKILDILYRQGYLEEPKEEKEI